MTVLPRWNGAWLVNWLAHGFPEFGNGGWSLSLLYVKDMTADGVVNFMGTKEGITVDAADFAEVCAVTAWEEGVDGPATSVWEDFNLRVVPTDAYGNASLKTFFNKIPKTKGTADSLDILDTRLANKGNNAKVYSEVNVRFSTQLLEDVPTAWPISGEGRTFSARALDRPGREATVRVDIDNTFIDVDRCSQSK